MTNFKPFKDYMLFVLNKFNNKYNLQSPFLDGGTGQGELSLYLANQGFIGDAIDISKEPLKIARTILKDTKVNIIHKDILYHKTKYRTIFLFDIIEHIKNDFEFFKSISSNLEKGGYVILTIPNNPSVWGWDDKSYGHLRRYTEERIDFLFKYANIEILKSYDVSFPFFWLMRNISLKVLKPKVDSISTLELTKQSTMNPYWKDFPLIKLINNSKLWTIPFLIQYQFRKLKWGQELMIIGRKK